MKVALAILCLGYCNLVLGNFVPYWLVRLDLNGKTADKIAQENGMRNIGQV